jgi:hypothetical protein
MVSFTCAYFSRKKVLQISSLVGTQNRCGQVGNPVGNQSMVVQPEGVVSHFLTEVPGLLTCPLDSSQQSAVSQAIWLDGSESDEAQTVRQLHHFTVPSEPYPR